MKLFSWGSWWQIPSFFCRRCTQIEAVEEGLLFFCAGVRNKRPRGGGEHSELFCEPQICDRLFDPWHNKHGWEKLDRSFL